MKKIITLVLVSLLSGCSLWMASYDGNEYGLVNKLRTEAILGDCSRETVKSMYFTSVELKNFSEYTPRNQATIELVNNLNVIVEELYKRENPSPVYCKAKLNTIAKSAEEIQRVVGSKPR